MIDATPLLRLYAKRRWRQIEQHPPGETQEKELLKLVRTAEETRFGAEHDFSKIRSIKDFQERVPLRTYEQFWSEYWQQPFPQLDNCTWPGRIPYFPVSSGTTSGTTKYIPFTSEMIASNRKAGMDLLCHHIRNRPNSKIMGGRSFMLGGSTELVKEAPGVYSGDLSGLSVKTLPWWARQRYFPPAKLALLKNWEEKIEILARESLSAGIRMISGVPSWLIIFFEKLFELRPEAKGKIAGVYPELEMLVHGGVHFAPYYDRFVGLLEGSRCEMREVYPASEGFVAVADRCYQEGLRVILDHGIFYEFVPVEELEKPNPVRHTIKDIELDVNYAVVLSTCAGLWSYILGDTVRFVDRNRPRLLITGRTSYSLSAFGEHLIGEELEDAVTTAAKSIGLTVNDYSAGPVFPDRENALGGHIYIVEFREQTPDSGQIDQFASALDQRLCQRNEDYEAHRADGYGLRSPEILPVPAGTFRAWMKKRGKLGGQNKVPRIINNLELLEDLRTFAQSASA